MYQTSYVICPYLAGSPDGLMCSNVNRFIKDMEDGDIRLCMSRRYEVCSMYINILRKMALNSIGNYIEMEQLT